MDEVVHHHGNILLICVLNFGFSGFWCYLSGWLESCFLLFPLCWYQNFIRFQQFAKKKRGHLKTLSVLQGPLSLSFFGRLQMYTAEGTHVRSVKQVVLAHRYKRSGKMHMGDQCSCVFFLFQKSVFQDIVFHRIKLDVRWLTQLVGEVLHIRGQHVNIKAIRFSASPVDTLFR